MIEVLNAGIEFIVWQQAFHTPALDQIFTFITNLGGRYYLFMIPLLLWSVDYRMGTRVVTLFAVTLFINSTIKEWIAQPRPFQFDDRVISDGEQGYGLPSGHAQLVVVFWGLIADWMQRPWFWGVAVTMMFLIGFSRVYLGVHFPSDVVSGWALGAATLLAVLRWKTDAAAWIERTEPARLVAFAFATAAILILFDFVAVRDHDNLDPASAGLMAGAASGWVLANKSLRFTGHGPLWKRALRYVVGMALLIGLIAVFQKLGAPEGEATRIVVAIDLALMGFFLTFGAPWLFEKIRLSDG